MEEERIKTDRDETLAKALRHLPSSPMVLYLTHLESQLRHLLLWVVAGLFQAEGSLETTLNHNLEVNACHNLNTSDPVHASKFSAGSQYLATNLGHVRAKRIIAHEKGAKFEYSEHLHISDHPDLLWGLRQCCGCHQVTILDVMVQGEIKQQMDLQMIGFGL
jgi:hypothetical protein